MYLIQLLLPLYDNRGERFPLAAYTGVRDELMQRFGGLTVYARSPANGLWQESEGRTVYDDLVIFEVMVSELDKDWWGAYRSALEQRFEQEALVVRSFAITTL